MMAVSQQHRYDVVVVGSGHVGSAFALAAANQGLRIALLGVPGTGSGDPAAGAEPWDRRVYALGAASRGFLEELRVLGQIPAGRIAPVRDMRVFDAGASRSTELHFSAYQAGTDALAWIVEHCELSRVFDTAISFHHGIDRITEPAEQICAGPTEVRLSVGNRSIHAALLVGADGARSFTRTAAGIETTIKPYDQTGVVANFACEKSHRGCAYQWFTDQGVIALLPLPGDAVSLVWSAPSALADSILSEAAGALEQRLAPYAQSPLGELHALGTMAGFPLSMITTSRQVGERLALIGDAAHVVHPLAGQGLNLGFDDARVLIETLAKREAVRDCGDAVLLRRYERARAESVWAMRQVTDGLTRLFGNPYPLIHAARASGMRVLNQLPMLKSALVRHAMG